VNGCQLLAVVLPECQLRVVAAVCRKSRRCTALGSLVIA
jgi:hypothetical protein